MPPAKLPSLPEVMTMPFTASSARASSISASRSSKPCWFITFIDLPWVSQVIVATPCASVSMVKSVMGLAPYTRSMMVAAPMPLAMHSVASPTSLSERSISSSRVPMMIAPEAPSG